MRVESENAKTNNSHELMFAAFCFESSWLANRHEGVDISEMLARDQGPLGAVW